MINIFFFFFLHSMKNQSKLFEICFRHEMLRLFIWMGFAFLFSILCFFVLSNNILSKSNYRLSLWERLENQILRIESVAGAKRHHHLSKYCTWKHSTTWENPPCAEQTDDEYTNFNITRSISIVSTNKLSGVVYDKTETEKHAWSVCFIAFKFISNICVTCGVRYRFVCCINTFSVQPSRSNRQRLFSHLIIHYYYT